jgi:hypothetical protein
VEIGVILPKKPGNRPKKKRSAKEIGNQIKKNNQ